MKLADVFQKLCSARHPLERGMELNRYLQNGGGHDVAKAISAVLSGWKSVPFDEDTAPSPVERATVSRALTPVLGRLNRILIATENGSNERAAAIATALAEFPTELERGVLLGLLLARRAGPLAECLYVTAGNDEQHVEAFESQDLRRYMLK